jgi:DNA sulfur modification protein DndE
MPEIRVPSFPDIRVSIVDYGAVADGHTMNNKAFADAITACAKLGGGTVEVPPGSWLTGPIKIESNINLHLERGALIQFSRRLEDFPLIAGFDGKSKRYIVTPPIHAFRARNIAITGDGIVDGSGEVWRYVKKEKQTERQWKDLVASGGVVSPDGKEWWPSKEAMEAEEYLKRLEESEKPPTAADYAKAREFLRTDMVQFVQCDGILLDGTTFQNSPRFHVRPTQSENIIIRGLKVLAPWYAQNADGIDLASCRNVIVYNTIVDAGDDGICLKPGTIAQSQKPGPACENIVVVDCVVYRAHGGFVIGSESYGGVNNVYVHNCVFSGTDVGLRFKSARGRGGLVENIFVDGIQMRMIENEAILFDMYYGGGAPEVEATKDLSLRKTEAVTDRTPRFQNFSVKNVVCNGANRGIVINGLPEMPIKNITLENVSVSSKLGVFCADADGISFNGCRIVPQTGPAMTVIQGRNITVKGGTFPAPTDLFLKVVGERSGNIRLAGVQLPRGTRVFELGKDVKSDAIIVER